MKEYDKIISVCRVSDIEYNDVYSVYIELVVIEIYCIVYVHYSFGSHFGSITTSPHSVHSEIKSRATVTLFYTVVFI